MRSHIIKNVEIRSKNITCLLKEDKSTMFWSQKTNINLRPGKIWKLLTNIKELRLNDLIWQNFSLYEHRSMNTFKHCKHSLITCKLSKWPLKMAFGIHYSFLHQTCSLLKLSWSEISSSEQIFTSSVIHSGVFLSLMAYLYSSMNTWR